MLKRSHEVQLLVIGTLAMLGVQYATREKLEVKQNVYASRADCEQDWGNDMRNCSPSENNMTGHSSGSGGGGGHGGGYAGPRYYWDREIGRPVALSADGDTRILSNSYLNRGGSSMAESVHVSSISIPRGGFGASGHGFSSGG